MNLPQYGTSDATFQAAGGVAGISQLVDAFYDIMASDLEYATIMAWHPKDNRLSRDKLARFLCGWMGGPPRYREKYGPISIPGVHAHLHVTERERDQWLGCMARALVQQGYPDDLVAYLLKHLYVPAERVRSTSRQQ